MSETLKSIHVRLSCEAYDALAAFAKRHGKKHAAIAQELLLDAIYGRPRGERLEIESSTSGFVYVIRVGDLYKIGKLPSA